MAVAWLWLLKPIFLFSTVFFITFPLTYSMSESEALLKLKSLLTNAKGLDSWVPGTDPCKGSVEQWGGVICFNGIVRGLRLENMGLSGKIDVDALGKLAGLRTMSLSNNSFTGMLPDLHRVGGLRAVYLTGNEFSGEIPPEFFDKMDALRRLWMGGNKFTGLIPPSLFQLTHLSELHLEKNQFTGPIPSFNQPTLMDLNLSNNKLEGEIPGTLSRFNASSFSGNPGLCGKSIGVECKKVAQKASVTKPNHIPPSPPPPSVIKKDDSKKIVAAVITLSVMLLSIAVVLIVKLRRKRKTFDVLEQEKESVQAVEVQVSVSNKKEVHNMSRKPGSSRRANSTKGGGVGELVVVNDKKGVFGLPDLMKAAAEVLGNGGLGSSYKAVMADGVTVVVKRMREMNTVGKDEFDAEIRKLGRLRHSNILTPLAYHYRKDEKLLVYEFIPKGSLLYLLHGDRGPSHDEFNWPARLKIVQGIARGIGYLHTELAHLDLPHGNLKSSNILLSPENEPLVSEYGFGPLINTANVAQALFAYRAPEVVQYGNVSQKCDVYCLGVIILEILTGKFPNQYLNSGKGGTDLVQWVASAFSEGNVTELLDPEIASSRNSIGEMEQLLQIGRACTESNPEQRLEMREAVRRIEEIQSDGNVEVRTPPTLQDGYGESDKSGRRHGSILDNFDHRLSGR